jgi:malonyl CoA-acyl carrier protein transacylase/SAM-dependent methyltransferase/acyl carrier protein
MALAGGANLILLPDHSISLSKARILAQDGRCKTFDAAADGFVRAEGCAIIVLKRLTDAIENKDNILALIRGWSTNQDGRSSSLTAPNGPSQVNVIREALKSAGIEPDLVGYVEAHGTGTALGDPIEIQALDEALCQNRSHDNPLLVGSVKTNIGHLESAAGIAGLMKTVLMLNAKEIPPHLHLSEHNPHIPWEKIPIAIPTDRTPLPQIGGRNIVGVSSFGFSGTNAHTILEAPPDQEITPNEVSRPIQLLTLSTKGEEALGDLAGRTYDYLLNDPGSLEDISYTTNVGRAHSSHRLAFLAESTADVKAKVSDFISGEESIGVFRGHYFDTIEPEIAFLFTGHGSQYAKMGQQLYETQPSFRATLEECEQYLISYLDQPLLSSLYTQSGDANWLDSMSYSQPALFALQYSLAQLWRSWGVEPTTVMGHSIGEYAAACVAGVFSLADGLKLVTARSRLLDSMTRSGQMAVIFSDESQVKQVLKPYEEQVSIAALNGPLNTVVSGETDAVQSVLADFKRKGIKSKKIAVPQASHSPLVERILAPFREVAESIHYSAPTIEIVSCLSGELASENEITSADYWVRHIRYPVRFLDAMNTLVHDNIKVFIEIGPNPTLLSMGRRCITNEDQQYLWLPSLRSGWDDWQQILESLATLYVNGNNIDWDGFNRDYPHRRIPLPTYPWQRERHWVGFKTDRHPQIVEALPPDWDNLLQAGHWQSSQAPVGLDLNGYGQLWDILDHLTTVTVMHTLNNLGVYQKVGEAHTLDDILSQFKILPNYRHLITRWMDRLVNKEFLVREDRHFVCSQTLPPKTVEKAWEDTRGALIDHPIVLDYLERCNDHLISILTGKENPLETLFPGGSFETANYIYNQWEMIGYYNNILKAILERLIRDWPANRQLSIIEIGSGTGGTAATLLPILPANRTHYQFTDVSELFFSKAEHKFRDYPFVNYGLLDIEKDPSPQGYPAHNYDFVIAANVIHATRNLEETLANALKLLKPGGLLLLCEVTDHLSWFDFTTGLIEGWHRFGDDWRLDHPLLSAQQWLELLTSLDFEKVEQFPSPGSPSEILAHHIIMGQASSNAVLQQDEIEGFPLPAQRENKSATIEERESHPHEKSDQFIRTFQEALPDERQELLITLVRDRLRKILRLEPDSQIDRRRRLMDLGVDSLMAVELRNTIGSDLGLTEPLSATLVFDYPTVEVMAEYLESEIEEHLKQESVYPTNEDPKQSSPKSGDSPELAAASVQDLSEEEVEALLLKKLKKLK